MVFSFALMIDLRVFILQAALLEQESAKFQLQRRLRAFATKHFIVQPVHVTCSLPQCGAM